MAAIKYVDLTRLTQYDGLMKNYVDVADAKSFKTAQFDEATRTLKFFKAENPAEGATADFSVEIPETDVSNLLEKIADGVVGNVVTVGANGVVVDGGVALADLATKEEVEAVDEKAEANATAIEKLNGDATTEGSVAKAVKDATDVINATIGTVAEGKTVVGMIEDVIADAYDDTEIRELIQDNEDAIEAHKTAIDATVTTLVGEDTGKSVRTIANEELAAQLLSGEAEADFQTLQELAAWLEDHPEDVATINLNISNLQALVGTLPEDTTATDIVGYIAEAVAVEKARAEGVESGLAERLTAVEEAVGEGGSVDAQIDAKIAELDADITSAEVEAGKGIQVQVVETDGKITAVNVTGNFDLAYDAANSASNAETNAKTYADGLNTAMDTRVKALEEELGDGIEAISEDEISALFA